MLARTSCLSVLVALLASGCGDTKLSKDEAQSAITAAAGERGLTGHFASFDFHIRNEAAQLSWLQSQGYLTVGTKPGLFGYQYIDAQQTDKGRKVFRNFRTGDFSLLTEIRIGRIEAVVENVMTDSKTGTAIVEYILRVVPEEPLYSKFCGETQRRPYECDLSRVNAQKARADLKKYDQGWRVESL